MESDNHEPTIIGFLCNWCAYQGIKVPHLGDTEPLDWSPV